MANDINRIKTQIDFTATRGCLNSSLIYTVLSHYNRGTATVLTASQLITEAYSAFDPSETEDATFLIDSAGRTQYFTKLYKIGSKEEMDSVVEHASVTLSIELLEPRKKFFCFDADDPEAIKMWESLNVIRYRSRSAVINRWLYQYMAHGNCPYYNRLCAERLLDWLKMEKKYADRVNPSKYESLKDMIWKNSQTAIPSPALSPEKYEHDISDREKRLRRAIGLL